MLSKAEKEEFFEGLCKELKNCHFVGPYANESTLTNDVVAVVEKYRNAKPYGNKIRVGSARGLIAKVNVFNREYGPDICIKEADGQPLVAIEVKLLREYWGVQRGIGQAVINSARYKYGIIFALDKRKFDDTKHEFDEAIQSSLWNNYQIRLIFR